MSGKREIDKERMFEKIMPSAALANRQAADSTPLPPDMGASVPAEYAFDADAAATETGSDDTVPSAAEAAEVFATQPPQYAEPYPEQPAAYTAVDDSTQPPASYATEMNAPPYSDCAAPAAAEAAEVFATQPPQYAEPYPEQPVAYTAVDDSTQPPASYATEMDAPPYSDSAAPSAAEAAEVFATQQPQYAEPYPEPVAAYAATEANYGDSVWQGETDAYTQAPAAPYNTTDEAHTPQPPPAEAVQPINLAEVLIGHLYPRYRQKLNGCACARCRDDATAIALNRIRPHYVPSDRIDPSALNDRELVTETVTALIKSLLLVKRKPRHTEEDLLAVQAVPHMEMA